MVGFCHLTVSHHYHHGQKPTMVGICHGGNMPLGHDGKGRMGWVGTLSTSNFQIFPSPCFWSQHFQHYYRRFTFHFHFKNDHFIFTLKIILTEDKSRAIVICPQDVICHDMWSTGVISEDQFPPSPSHQSHLFSLLSKTITCMLMRTQQ